jgi:hypothetical protein
MLGERRCVFVRYQDIVAELDGLFRTYGNRNEEAFCFWIWYKDTDLIGCTDSFNVAQISFILPALIYKSPHLNNEYMGFHMTDCSFRDHHETALIRARFARPGSPAT